VAPYNFNEAMYTGFQVVITGTRPPAEQAGALQAAWAEANKRGGKDPGAAVSYLYEPGRRQTPIAARQEARGYRSRSIC
jgi:hypothetical protein